MTRDLLSPLWRQQQLPAMSPRDWELLLAQARAARLLARLAQLCKTRGWMAAVPDGPRRHLESGKRFADRLRFEVLWEVEHIQAALQALPTPIVLLKGAAYLAAGLPPGNGRLFSDVDILVRREQLPAVESALFAAGWIAEKLKPYDDRYYRQWMHELPPLQHVQRRTYLDVHHSIAPPTSRFAVDGAALLTGCRALPEEPRLSVLAPVDMVLHSAVHLLQEGQFDGGLRDLLDLNDLLLHFGADTSFWPDLLQRARELGFGVPLGHALVQIDRLFGTRVPDRWAAELRSLAPPSASRRLMASLLAVALRPDHSSCDSRLTGLARWLLYVRSHWLRMPWYQIAPHLVRKAWARSLERYRSTPPAEAGV